MAELHNIFEFHGGLHLADHKAESNNSPVSCAGIPDKLILPLQQHIGMAAEPAVKVGEKVLKGQIIAIAVDYVSAPIHAPTSGIVSDIGEHAVPHPSGLNAQCIVIEPDGADEWADLPNPITDYRNVAPVDLRERIRWAGIVGLGGAAFPTSVKVNPGVHNKIDTLIINAVECEPYITCDDRLMREQPEQVLEGVGILMHLISARVCMIGIEDNKPEAAQALQQALDASGLENVSVCIVPTKYPSGGEKQLIKLLTGEEVPSRGLPAEIGVLCQNVSTTVAVANAVLRGKPLIERIVTLSGEGCSQPQNLRALFGSPMSYLVEQAGGYTNKVHRLIMGGPMMGFALPSDELPTIKATNCLLIASEQEAPDPAPATACIRCGKCHESCPANLLPQQMYWHARAKDLDKIQEYNLFDCIECGCCAHVCPANIPLVQYYRFAKTEIWASEREKQKAELARQRHEARVARLERLEAERKAKLRKKKEVLEKKPAGAKKDPKKAAIEAAMKRVAAKKAAQAKSEEKAEATAAKTED